MDVGFLKPPQGELFRKLASVLAGVDADIDALEAIANLKYIAKSLGANFNEELSSHKLSEGKLICLICILIEDIQEQEALSPSDLADRVGVTRATITGLIDGMERDGYIERRRASRDRRAITLHLSEGGRNVLKELLPSYSRMVAAILEPLTTEEKRQLVHLLGKIDLKRALPTE
jgi:MarR family transcriptional repressor of emrRAB